MESKQQQWNTYCNEQLKVVTPLLLNEGFILEEEQPHLKGERYLLSGPKLVLYGARKRDQKRVVIKITNDTTLTEELRREHELHELLATIRFAYQVFRFPDEILFARKDAYTFLITAYVPQEKKFLEYTDTEQFFLALKAFEAQEGLHATAYSHMREVRDAFEIFTSERYIETNKKYSADIHSLTPKRIELLDTVSQTVQTLEGYHAVLDTYANFLTHWDFVPHNIRIHDNTIYLLDHSAIRFGNKYEGWARFMNFMTLYNPSLAQMLDVYVKNNKFENEYASLHAMRLYRLTELLWFYVQKVPEAEGNVLTLTNARIDFWTEALASELNQTPLDARVIERYKKTRDTLRDAEERKRQEVLH